MRDKATVTVEDGGRVRLDPASFTLESAYGSVKPAKDPEGLNEFARNAKDAKAEETARGLRGA